MLRARYPTGDIAVIISCSCLARSLSLALVLSRKLRANKHPGPIKTLKTYVHSEGHSHLYMAQPSVCTGVSVS